MKPVLPSLKGNPRLKRILAFSAVITILFVGIAVNYMIELKVLHSVQDHNAKNDSVILQQKYQQVVEKTMFLISQTDHSLERFIQTGDSSKLEEFKNNSTIVGGNLELIKTSYAVYVPKYLVIFLFIKQKTGLHLITKFLKHTAKKEQVKHS